MERAADGSCIDRVSQWLDTQGTRELHDDATG
jgi:hypothetical protein